MKFSGVDVAAWNIQDIATIYSSLNTAATYSFPLQFGWVEGLEPLYWKTN